MIGRERLQRCTVSAAAPVLHSMTGLNNIAISLHLIAIYLHAHLRKVTPAAIVAASPMPDSAREILPAMGRSRKECFGYSLKL